MLIDDRPVPYARELWLPLVWFLHSPVAPVPADRHRTRPAAARGRTEAARSRVQHVLRRPAAEAAVGDARARRSDGQAARSRATSRTPAIASASRRCSRATRRFIDLWDRGLRAREEGRPGPFAQPPTRPSRTAEERPRIASCTSRRSAIRCTRCDKLHELYESLAEARREVGEDAGAVPQVRRAGEDQVKKLQATGSPEVAFRVAVKDGKVNFTARALKGVKDR